MFRLFLFFTVREVKVGQLWSTKLQEQQFQTHKLSLKRKNTVFFFWGGGMFFIILWNEEMTITNPQYGSNKHKCILVVKQRQFGLNVLLYTKNYFKPFKSKLCLYILVSMTLQLCDNFKSFIISDYCMPYNITILL